jgi:hypothetical protein
MPRNCFVQQKKFSIKCRASYSALSYVLGQFRFRFGGITAIFPAALSGSITRWSASYALSASNASAAIPGTNASAPARSWTCPAVRTIAKGLPRASTRTWILVLRPPLLLPIAWSSPAFFGRRNYVGGRVLLCCRSWHIHYPRRRPARRGW